MTTVDRDALRARCSAVFGNRYLAEVVAAIVAKTQATDTPITVRMLASHARLPDNLVRPVVKRLVEADLLFPQPQDRPRAPRNLEVRHPSKLWDALVKACKALESP